MEDADQLHKVNVHWLERAIITGEESMSKALLEELVEVENAVQLHYVNVHWLKFAMFAGEDCIQKA